MKCIIDKRIKDLRKDLKISQTELAVLCGVQQSCVSKWERGETFPDAEMIIKLCEVLNASADYLLGLKEY